MSVKTSQHVKDSDEGADEEEKGGREILDVNSGHGVSLVQGGATAQHNDVPFSIEDEHESRSWERPCLRARSEWHDRVILQKIPTNSGHEECGRAREPGNSDEG